MSRAKEMSLILEEKTKVVSIDGDDIEFMVIDGTHIKHRRPGESSWGAMAILHVGQLSDKWLKALKEAGLIDNTGRYFVE